MVYKKQDKVYNNSPPKPKGAYNNISWSDKVKNWDLLEGSMPLEEVKWGYGK
jgi:hypothetical protein